MDTWKQYAHQRYGGWVRRSCPSDMLSTDAVFTSVALFLTTRNLSSVQACSRGLQCMARAFVHLHTDVQKLVVGYTSPSKAATLTPYKLPQQFFLPAAHCVIYFGPLIQRNGPNVDESYVQCLADVGPVDQRSRAAVIDWLVHVSMDHKLIPSVLHCAVMLVDKCLSLFPIAVTNLRLLATVALFVESKVLETGKMDLDDVFNICCVECGYALKEFQVMMDMVNKVGEPLLHEYHTTNTLSVLAAICKSLNLHLVMHESITFNEFTSEDATMAIFVADLSLLDSFMLRFTPLTIACSSMLLSRLLLRFFAEQRILITPFGAVAPSNRECVRLIDSKRPYIAENEQYLLQPMGLPWLQQFVKSSTEETEACAVCVARLWKLYRDFFAHVYGVHSPSVTSSSGSGSKFPKNLVDDTTAEPPVLQFPDTEFLLTNNLHAPILGGMRNKYVKKGGLRDSVWAKLRPVPRDVIHAALLDIFGPEVQAVWDLC